MPKARLECRCQAPQPRSGAPKAQGLIARSGRSTIRHAVDRDFLPPHQPPITFHERRCTRGASASVSISTSLTDVTRAICTRAVSSTLEKFGDKGGGARYRAEPRRVEIELRRLFGDGQRQ